MIRRSINISHTVESSSEMVQRCDEMDLMDVGRKEDVECDILSHFRRPGITLRKEPEVTGTSRLALH